VRNTRQLRSHAALCLEVARQMSSAPDAETMRRAAVGYLLQAEAIEAIRKRNLIARENTGPIDRTIPGPR
jgi:hypothetical protein